MAISISEPVAEVSSNTDATSYATGSFTPAANSLLIAIVMATGTNAAGSFAGGSLTWTEIGTVLYSSNTCKGYAYRAQVGASPSSMTGTFDCTGDAATGCDIVMFQVTGHDTGTPIRQFLWAEDESVDVVGWTLSGGATLTTNAYIAAVSMHGDRLDWDPGPTAGGFTLTVDNQGHNAPAVTTSAGYRVNGLTASSYAWQCNDIVDVAGIFIEINAGAEGGGGGPIYRIIDHGGIYRGVLRGIGRGI